MHLNHKGTRVKNVRFFWGFGENGNDCFEITDCAILDEAALAWPVGHDSHKLENGVVYGAIEGLKIDHHCLRKMLLFQTRSFDKKNITKVRDLAVGCVDQAVFPLVSTGMPPRGFRNVELLLQIIDVRVEGSANCSVIHSKGGDDTE